MADLAIQTIQKSNGSTLLQRIVEKDKTAVKDCIDTYGNFIWVLAKKYTASTEEAEVATQEIFIDIWQYCGSRDKTTFVEEKLIAIIALRRLIKHARQNRQISMANIDSLDEQG